MRAKTLLLVTVSALLVCNVQASITADYEIYTTIGGGFDGTPFSGTPAITGSRSSVLSTLFPGYESVSLSPSGESDLSYFPFSTYSARMTGSFFAASAGTFSFGTYSDDGSTLYVDGNLVINNGGAHGPASVFQTALLAAGTHIFTVNYFEDFGGQANLTAYFDPALTTVPEPSSICLAAVAGLAWFGRRLLSRLV